MKAARKIPPSLDTLGTARFRRRAIAAAAAVLFVLPGAAGAATIVFGDTCSLTGAINSANSDTAQGGCPAGSGADIIVLPASATPTVNSAALPDITSPITIQGNGSTLQRGGSAPAFRLFTVTATGDLTLNDLTLANGQDSSEYGGGGIQSEGRLVLNRCTVTGNRSDSRGGGIAVANGSFELNDSTVSANSAANRGGGLRLGEGAPISTAIRGSTITGNTSGIYGGGLDMRVNGDGLRQTIDRSTITNNSTGRNGGGISATDSLTITNSTISGNTALEFGGGIYHRLGPLLLRDSSVADNRSVSGGGAGILAAGTDLLLVNSTVSGNLAGTADTAEYDDYGNGAGIYHYGNGGSVSLRYSTVSGNSAYGDGGGIFSRAPVTTLSNSQVTGNTAAYDGGGINTVSAALEIKYSSVSNNVAEARGGGILVESDGSTRPGSLNLTNSTVAGNRSVQETGGIDLSFDVTATIENSTIAANRGAGVTALNRASATIRNSTITGNSFVQPSPSFGGAGIAKTGSGLLTLERNIVSGNGIPSSVPGQEISLQAGLSTLANNGSNVLGSSAHTSAQAFNAFTPVASDRTATSNGTHPTVIGNILGAGPANNGGPTLTFNTRGGSPARDFIPSSLCAGEVDQRGVVRPKDGQNGQPNIGNECDAGSVESSGFNAVDLSITKTSNGPVFVGTPLTYSITLRNDGPEPANGIEVYDTLPAGLEFVSSSDSNPLLGECGEDAGTVECRLRVLAPSEEITFNVVAGTTAVGPVTNEVSFINDTLINTNAAGTDFDAAVTTQVIGPTVTLSVSPASIAEAAGVATLRATLSQAVSIPIVVNLAYTGTAGTGDYTRPASITVPAGATSATAPLTAVADGLDENDETIIASINSVPNGMIGSPNSATVTITDDDATPTVSFTLAEQAAGEGTSRTVTAQLSAVSGRAVTVPIDFDGTADNPADYSRSATSIVIPAGAPSASLTLSFVDDTLDEPSETVVMSFGTLVNATAGTITTQTVTIVDNDGAPTVSFDSAGMSYDEGAGTIMLPVRLSSASAQVVSVGFTPGGAAGSADYSIASASPLMFSPGTTVVNLVVNLVDDALDEPDESVILSLNGPVNAALGSFPSFTAIILASDDLPDPFGFTAVSGVAPNSQQTSNTVVLGGFAGTAPISVMGGQYSIGCLADGFTTAPGTVTSGQTVCVRHTASSLPNTAVETRLAVGGVSGTFRSSTGVCDMTPDAFNFFDPSNVPVNTVQTSEVLTLQGLSCATPLTIDIGLISVNGGAFVAGPVDVSNGDRIQARHTSSPNPGTHVQSLVYVNGILSASFRSTTAGVAAPPLTPDTLVRNGGFEAGSLSPWFFYAVGNALGTAAVDSTVKIEGTRSARVNVTRADPAAPWNATLAQPVNLVAGTTYTLRFRAMADRSRAIRAVVQLNSSPFTGYLTQTPALTTAWREFTYTFTAPMTTAGVLSFNVGQSVGNVWFDAVSFTAGGAPPPPPPPPTSNILLNAGFENGTLNPWYFFATGNALGSAAVDSTVKFEGTRSARIAISRADAATPWNAQLAQRLNLVAGRTYTMRFRAMADRVRNITAVAQLDRAPFTNYLVRTAALNTGWQEFVFTFTAPATVGGLLNFHLAQSLGTVWIDAVSVQ
ncbi:MAG: carbohydrate binding domain-containing protein [Panacagrimonas sp.]